jgi:hypothetical protein
MKDERPEGFTRADANVSCNGFAIGGGQFFLYGPSYKTRTSSRFVRVFCYKKVGADDGIRTHDINLGKVALYP